MLYSFTPKNNVTDKRTIIIFELIAKVANISQVTDYINITSTYAICG